MFILATNAEFWGISECTASASNQCKNGLKHLFTWTNSVAMYKIKPLLKENVPVRGILKIHLKNTVVYKTKRKLWHEFFIMVLYPHVIRHENIQRWQNSS